MRKDILVFNICNFMGRHGGAVLGENVVQSILSDFSCKKNKGVEDFLKYNAVEFSKKHQSVTYLVLDKDDLAVLGYFTLALKPITIDAMKFSKTTLKKIARVSKLSEDQEQYSLAAYLIAQLGKNFSGDLAKRISGNDLLDAALEEVRDLQNRVGGMVCFLEAENHEKLLRFYTDYGFKSYDERKIKGDITLVQMLKIL